MYIIELIYNFVLRTVFNWDDLLLWWMFWLDLCSFLLIISVDWAEFDLGECLGLVRSINTCDDWISWRNKYGAVSGIKIAPIGAVINIEIAANVTT